MYDEIVKSVDLTSDEVDLLNEMLFYHLDKCVCIGEEVTVRGLLDKLK